MRSYVTFNQVVMKGSFKRWYLRTHLKVVREEAVTWVEGIPDRMNSNYKRLEIHTSIACLRMLKDAWS